VEKSVRGWVDKTSVPEGWLFPLIRDGDPHWWLLYADVGAKTNCVIDPLSPNSAAPDRRVQVAQELLEWVLRAMFGKRITFEEMEYFPQYNYVLPAQLDGYNCGVYVGLYMTMFARNIINYRWPLEIDEYRWRLAVAFERNDPEVFLETQHQQ
jgi:Ulp1 family protease